MIEELRVLRSLSLQTDIHSPQTTVHEALLYSAFLRLPGAVSSAVKTAFVEEIMEVVELTPIRNAIVGLPGMFRLFTVIVLQEQCIQRVHEVTRYAGPLQGAWPRQSTRLVA